MSRFDDLRKRRNEAIATYERDVAKINAEAKRCENIAHQFAVGKIGIEEAEKELRKVNIENVIKNS